MMSKLYTLLLLTTVVMANSAVLSLFPRPARRTPAATAHTVDKAALGKAIFFDKNLSSPAGLSCAGCHSPAAGFSDPYHRVVSEGAVRGLFTNRNAPAISYSMYIPALRLKPDDATYSGGYFLDGRANTLEEQALKPFFNPLEMNNANAKTLAAKIRAAGYYSAYRQLYSGAVADDATILANVADAIAAFERSPDLNPFTSKYDYYLRGQASLTAQELEGLRLFNSPVKGNCASCHPSTADPAGGPALFTDFTYDNIGVPRNPANPYYAIPARFNADGMQATDSGLGGCVKQGRYGGQFRVPGLRNVALTAPYFHNGYFNTLEEVVHFYNKRDVLPYAPAEVPATVNHKELGNLQLSPAEERDIVSFLKTLTDGYQSRSAASRGPNN